MSHFSVLVGKLKAFTFLYILIKKFLRQNRDFQRQNTRNG